MPKDNEQYSEEEPQRRDLNSWLYDPKNPEKIDNRALNVGGLVLNLLGVVLLFFFGLPPGIRTNGAVMLVTGAVDQAAIAGEAFDDLFGQGGLCLLIVGMILQIVAAVRAN
jgi:hypothetical protein